MGQHFPVVIGFLCVIQTIPKKQVGAKAPVKAAAAPAQKSISSEDSSSDEEEEEPKKKPMKKKPGDWTRGVKLPLTRAQRQENLCSHHMDLGLTAGLSQRKEKAKACLL